MPNISGIRRVFRLPRRPAHTLDADVDEELRFHLDLRAAELAARRGLDAAAARAEALRQFGDVDDARRYIRALDARTETATRRREFMDDLRQDLRHALRGLRRSPGFAAVVVLALALGIGATTSIFTVINAILLRPLPVPNGDRLVGFGDPAAVGVASSGFPRTDLFSYPLYTELQGRARRVSGLLASSRVDRLDVVVLDSANARATGEAEHPRTALVSGNYFAVLGVPAAAGRTLTADDDRAPGAGPVAVISHDYWKRRFALDPAAVGRTVAVNGTRLVIVGVARPGFAGEAVGAGTELWIPLTMQPLLLPNADRLRDRNANWLMLMGRLAPDATVAQAGAELTALARQSLADAGGTPAPNGVEGEATVDAYPGARGFSRARAQAGGPLTILLAAAGLVLVVVCANVANLLLARAAARRTEIGVRLALGAGRSRLLRQLLAESVVLGVGAGALGVGVTWVGIVMLLRVAADGGSAPPIDVSLDGRVLAFSTALSLLTATLVGLAPALRATRVDLATTLRSHGRGVSGGPLGGGGRRLGMGRLLVVGQAALSLVLLVGSGVLVRSLRTIEGAPVGLARDELLVVSVDARSGGYVGDRLIALCRQLAERLQAVPGVRAVTYSENGIFSGIDASATLQVDGFVPRAAEDTSASSDQVGPGYFRTIGARIVRGRDIEARDDARAPRVAVINETMARFFFAGRDPVGQGLRIDNVRREIVGVVADVTDHDLRTKPTRRFYTALAQGGGAGSTVFVLRTLGDPARATAAVRREILAAGASLRVLDARPLTEMMRDSIGGERFLARIAGVAGGLALGLAALGLYGVMTYMAVRRTSEFGLRLALGARPSDVTRLVLREGMTLFALGAAVGLPVSLGATRILQQQLVGVRLVDLPTLAVALAVLGASAAAAGYRPARRAARVAPQVALHEE